VKIINNSKHVLIVEINLVIGEKRIKKLFHYTTKHIMKKRLIIVKSIMFTQKKIILKKNG